MVLCVTALPVLNRRRWIASSPVSRTVSPWRTEPDEPSSITPFWLLRTVKPTSRRFAGAAVPAPGGHQHDRAGGHGTGDQQAGELPVDCHDLPRAAPGRPAAGQEQPPFLVS